MKNEAPKRIDDVSQLVKALGGTFALARWADVSPSVVSNWKKREHIPTGLHLRLYFECERRRLNVSPKLWTSGTKTKGKARSKANGRRPKPLASLRLEGQPT